LFSKTNELGLNGSAMGLPATNVEVADDRVIDTIVGLQVALVGFAMLLPHAVVVAYTVGLVVVVEFRTRKAIADCG